MASIENNHSKASDFTPDDEESTEATDGAADEGIEAVAGPADTELQQRDVADLDPDISGEPSKGPPAEDSAGDNELTNTLIKPDNG